MALLMGRHRLADCPLLLVRAAERGMVERFWCFFSSSFSIQVSFGSGHSVGRALADGSFG